MRMLWITPLPKDGAASAQEPCPGDGLGLYLRLVLPELARRTELSILTFQTSWEPWIDEHAQVHAAAHVEDLWAALNDHDLCVYHLGDDPEIFGDVLETAARHPGLVVVHSPSIHRLVATVLARFQNRPEAYLDALRAAGGETAEQTGRRWLESSAWTEGPPDSLLSYLDPAALALIGHLGPDPRRQDKAPTGPAFHYLPLPAAADDAADPMGPAANTGAGTGRDLRDSSSDVRSSDSEATEVPAPRRRLVLLTDGQGHRSPFPLLEALAQNIVHRQVAVSLFTDSEQVDSLRAALEGLQLADYVEILTEPSRLDSRLEGTVLLADYRHVSEIRRRRDHERWWRRGIPTCAPSRELGPWPVGTPMVELRPDYARADFGRILAWLELAPDSLHDYGLRAADHVRQLTPSHYVERFLTVADQAAAGRLSSATLAAAGRAGAMGDPTVEKIFDFHRQLATGSPIEPALQPAAGSGTAGETTLEDRLRILELALDRESRARRLAETRLQVVETRLAALTERSGLSSAETSLYLSQAGDVPGDEPAPDPAAERRRLEVFHLWVLELSARFPGGTCLDLRCGHGVWLDLLGEHGLRGAGADERSSAVRHCREKGLDVELGDGLTALRHRGDESAVLISVFDVAERLPTPTLLGHWLAEIRRVLCPGGLIILESANPQNLDVRARLGRDPGQLRLVHPMGIHAQLSGAGFESVEIHQLSHGRAGEQPLIAAKRSKMVAPELSRAFELLNRHLSAAPAFAAVARKPSVG